DGFGGRLHRRLPAQEDALPVALEPGRDSPVRGEAPPAARAVRERARRAPADRARGDRALDGGLLAREKERAARAARSGTTIAAVLADQLERQRSSYP